MTRQEDIIALLKENPCMTIPDFVNRDGTPSWNRKCAITMYYRRLTRLEKYGLVERVLGTFPIQWRVKE